MKTLLLSCMGLLFVNQLSASIDTLFLTSKISNVTIFFNGAQVERTVDVRLTKGKHILMLDGLTQELNPSTLQVKGMKNFKIVAVKHQLNYQGKAKENIEIVSINKQIDEQEKLIKEINNQLYVFAFEEKLLLDNSKFQQSSKGITVAEIQEAASFYRAKLNEIQQKKLDLNLSLIGISKKIKAFYVKLNELNIEKRKVYSQVMISLDAERDAYEIMALTYYTESAGWEPLYDFRVEDVSKPLSIVYNANVFQSTGEDWRNVVLKLSTNNPLKSGVKPVLKPWYAENKNAIRFPVDEKGFGVLSGRIFDKVTNEPLPFVKISVKKDGQEIARTSSDFDGAYQIKPIEEGSFSIEMSYVGFENYLIRNVSIIKNNVTFVDQSLQPDIKELESVTIVAYKNPLISRDAGFSGSTIQREDIGRMAVRSSADVASTVGGVNMNENGQMSIRGGRSDASYYYIDGIKVRGSSNLPKSAIEEVSVITGGTPAGYGGGINYSHNTGHSTSSKVESGFNSTDFVDNNKLFAVTNLEYDIEIPYTIMSDGQDYLLRIKELEIPVDYIYHAVPKLDKDVFLTAELSKWNQLSLLSGKTSIYFKGTYIGESFLDVENMKDTLEVDLGRDQNVFVSRTTDLAISEVKESGNYVKQTVGWNIVVKNNKNTPIYIEIEDQFPITNNKSITIERMKVDEGKVDENSGIITWGLQFAPGEIKKVNYQYSVKYPKYVSVAN